MNKVQTCLANWLSMTYGNINESCMEEAEIRGYKQEDFDSGKIELVHNVILGAIKGLSQFTYSVKEGDKLTNIITVEFKIDGYKIYSHRKTKIVKDLYAAKRLSRN